MKSSPRWLRLEPAYGCVCPQGRSRRTAAVRALTTGLGQQRLLFETRNTVYVLKGSGQRKSSLLEGISSMCHGLARDDSTVSETKISSVRTKLTWQAFPECLVMGCCIGMAFPELSLPTGTTSPSASRASLPAIQLLSA